MAKYNRSIIILADGARFDVFGELLEKGQLPNIKRHIVDGGTFSKAVTAFPSTTGPAHMPFLTGCLSATCNVPGIRWFDKRMYGRYGHGSVLSLGAHGRYRSYVGIETFRINDDMRSDIYTTFEIIPKSYSIFNSINRGVGRRNLTTIMRIWYWYYAHQTDRWRFVDNAAAEKLLNAIGRDFEFLFAVFPGIDEFSHLNHPRDEAAIRQYIDLDATVGKMVEKLVRLRKLDDTLLWIVSDHGLSRTHTHFCINTFLESRGIRTFYFPLVWRKNCLAANMVSGNGMTHIYFKRRDGWGEPAALSDIDEMYPELLNDLLAQDAVDILAVRDDNGNIVIRTKKGEGVLKFNGDDITYVVNSSDPFGYDPSLRNSRFTFNDSRHMISATIDSDYPDAPYQLAHIFSSPRCGDVVVSATPGFDLRIKYEDPEHKSSHGSLHRDHMLVPVLTNIQLPNNTPFRTVDVFPTYLQLMGHKIPANIDGSALSF